jgi:hypothetical protein
MLGMNKYLKADVLTSRQPVKSFKDYTIPDHSYCVKRIGKNWIAKLWGLLAPLLALRFIMRYKQIIITSPPETLILWAYLLQLAGKDVILDMRDSYYRKEMKLKFLIPVYACLYKKVRHKVVAFQFISSRATVIYSGHDSLIRKTDSPAYYYTPSKRLSFLVYNDLLTKGRIPTMMNKPEGYCSSAIHNIKHLGYEIDNQMFHPEAYTCKPITHEQAARQYLELMKNKLT